MPERGQPQRFGAISTRPCITDGCAGEADVRWMCRSCYNKAHYRGQLTGKPRMKRRVPPTIRPEDWASDLPTEPGERWTIIPSFPDYAASTHGRIYSRTRYGTPGGIRAWCFPTSQGPQIPYPQVGLSQGGTRWVRRVHTLVLEAFVGPRPDGLEARHLDGNYMNARLDNLEWATHVDNMADQLRHGTRVLLTHCKRQHELSGSNLYVSPKGRRGCRKCHALSAARTRAAGRECAA